MKNLFNSLLLAATLMGTVSASAQEISPVVFMNKITQRLVGSSPQPADWEKLAKEMKSKQCNAVACLDSFFRDYIREKMKKPEFYAIFYEAVTDRFGYKSPPSAMISQIIALSGKEFSDPSQGRDFALVYRTLKENQSFDELFTSQIITDPVYKNDVTVSAGTMELAGIDTSKVGSGGATASYNIELENGQTLNAAEYNMKDHANISGLFTTRRFLERYWNSPLNQNRKRASAFFRIMLCDAMSPALERETEKEKELRMALGRSEEQVIIDEIKSVHANRHATQKDCAACHTRLDPIGKTMRAMEIGVSGESFKGELKFFDSKNEMTTIPVKNFHDLTVKAVALPKYLDCQANWLVETYLGKDLSLSTRRLTEVVDGIEKRKRRLKSVIEDLLMMPEFRGLSQKIAEPASMKAAKDVLANCTECHSDTFKLRPEQMKARLNRVAVCLDLPNNGKGAQMPPSDHYWQPTGPELTAVKAWIQEGAPLGEGIKIFEQNEVNQLLSPNKESKKCRQ